MVNDLEMMTQKQTKSRDWFRYRAGRMTAYRFRQILHTDPNQPCISLLKSICYPKPHRFSTKAGVVNKRKMLFKPITHNHGMSQWP